MISKILTCDKCGAEIEYFNNYQISANSARLSVYGIGCNRTAPSQKIDLCEECYEKFITWLEQGE